MSGAHQIEALTSGDVASAAQLHLLAFPGYFLSSLGAPFLREFYRGFLGDYTAVTLVARDASGNVRGAAVGTLEPEGFFGRLIRRRLLAFTLLSGRTVMRSPRTAPKLLNAIAYRGDAPSPAAGALLSSICVDPSTQGLGLGSLLLSQWTAQVAARGGRSAYLTTDALDNDAVNQFYRSAGWNLTTEFTTPAGRKMNRYTTTAIG